MSIPAKVIAFYLGTFLSSVGSLLLVMTIPAFFIANAIPATSIALSIGIHRFSGIAAAIWFGPTIDHFNAKKVILVTELVAAIATAGLWFGWQTQPTYGLGLFWASLGLRALALGAQTASRNRLVKVLADSNETKEASYVIWLTKATQGAHVISALVALGMLSTGNLGLAILFDGFTFLLSGAAVWMLPVNPQASPKTQKRNLLSAFADFVRQHRDLVWQDGLLAVSVTGTILLMVKLSQSNPRHLIFLNLIFGACIWLSSIVAHRSQLRQHKNFYWSLLAAGFACLAMFSGNFLAVLASFFLAYMAYWILYHIYTVDIQTKTPLEMIGGVVAARTVFVAVILSLGELLGSKITLYLSLNQELWVRFAVCIVAMAMVLKTKIRRMA